MDQRTRIIVLGSLPGEESLAQQRYYANPRNHFWRLIGRVVERDLAPLPYEERLAALLETGIGLWDVVASASRAGSLDAAIRDHNPNDLRALVAELPLLKAVAFNGGTSARIGQKLLTGMPHALAPLPSSSPAFTMSFERKLQRWLALRAYL